MINRRVRFIISLSVEYFLISHNFTMLKLDVNGIHRCLLVPDPAKQIGCCLHNALREPLAIPFAQGYTIGLCFHRVPDLKT